MKVKITRIAHLEKDKAGAPLVTKDGRPYKRCLIDLEDGRKVSGFGNALTESWSDGDEVDIILEQKGEYWNFKTPKAGDNSDLVNEIHKRVTKLEDHVFGAAKVEAEVAVDPTDDF